MTSAADISRRQPKPRFLRVLFQFLKLCAKPIRKNWISCLIVLYCAVSWFAGSIFVPVDPALSTTASFFFCGFQGFCVGIVVGFIVFWIAVILSGLLVLMDNIFGLWKEADRSVE